jgi:predicted HicB family RNase H-like nuclease
MSRPKLSMLRPSTNGASSGPSRAAARVEGGQARLVVELTAAAHRELKARAAARGQSLRDYVLGCLDQAAARETR